MPLNYNKRGTKDGVAADFAALVGDAKNPAEAAQIESLKPLVAAEIASVKQNGVNVTVRASVFPQRSVAVQVAGIDLVV
jgi:hypothetical protein